MRWRRKPNEHQLRSWLHTGAPAEVERWIDDPDVSERLERLSQLPDDHTEALRGVVAPTAGFTDRTTAEVQRRIDDLERLGVVLGLLGLGPRTVSTWIEPERD